MPLELIDFWFILCLYNQGTQVTYFKLNVGSNLLVSARHRTAVKLIGPQMAGFGISAGAAHHMSLYIMSYALLQSPEGGCT